MFLTDYDAGKGIIEPKQVFSAIEGMPRVCIGVFSHLLVKEWVERHDGRLLATQRSVSGDREVYKISAGGAEFALFVPSVGAPGAAGGMEELIANGTRGFIYCGCCGVLRHDIAAAHLLVPTAAIRDEGTSFHYAPPADEIAWTPA